jgi:pantothenate synthetase
MKQPKLFIFSKLTNIKENKKELLDTFNFKTIHDAKKTEKFKNLKADEIYKNLSSMSEEISKILAGGIELNKKIQRIIDSYKEKFINSGFEIDYIEYHWSRILIAARVDGVRLIDNIGV